MVGLSHRARRSGRWSAPRSAATRWASCCRDVLRAEHVAGTFVVSTCNRVEIYAEVDKFHGGVGAISELLARHSGIAAGRAHRRTCTCTTRTAPCSTCSRWPAGLDSMVVGESQILGQVRAGARRWRASRARSAACSTSSARWRCGRASGRTPRPASTGPARTWSAWGRARGRAAARAARRRGPAPLRSPGRVLVVGAGLDELAGRRDRRPGPARPAIVVANRTPVEPNGWRPRSAVRCRRDSPGCPPRWRAADLVISCTGAAGVVITEGGAGRGHGAAGPRAGRWSCSTWRCRATSTPPRPALPGVTLIDLEALAGAGAARAAAAERGRGRGPGRSSPRSSPPGCRPSAPPAWRRPWSRCGRRPPRWSTPSWPGWTGRLGRPRRAGSRRDRPDRAAGWSDKLLHAPTVRVKELAGAPGGDSYAEALRVLCSTSSPATRCWLGAAPADAGRVAGDDRAVSQTRQAEARRAGAAERAAAAARHPPEPDGHGPVAAGRRALITERTGRARRAGRASPRRRRQPGAADPDRRHRGLRQRAARRAARRARSTSPSTR